MADDKEEKKEKTKKALQPYIGDCEDAEEAGLAAWLFHATGDESRGISGCKKCAAMFEDMRSTRSKAKQATGEGEPDAKTKARKAATGFGQKVVNWVLTGKW